MTTSILVIIAVMWLPVALLNLGKGEAKGTGSGGSCVFGTDTPFFSGHLSSRSRAKTTAPAKN